MGLFDKFKKKAQEAVGQAQAAVHGATGTAPEETAAPAASTGGAPPAGSFSWDGDVYALPTGWDGLSMEDWFLKYSEVRDHMMRADEEDLPRMQDEDGDDLDPEEVLLITKYGFKTGGTWEAYRNYMVSGFAQQTGESFTDLEFRMVGIAREKITAKKAEAMSAPGGALSPVEGVSVEQWAQIQAGVAGGGALPTLLADAGMDQAKWDRVSAEWMARMQTDTSHTISTVYSNAFAGGGQFGAQAAQAVAQGVGGNVGAEPVPFERFVEIQEAMGAASARGEDVNAMLSQNFGISAMDWSNIGQYWSKKMQQEITKYHALFTEYSAKYKAKYGG